MRCDVAEIYPTFSNQVCRHFDLENLKKHVNLDNVKYLAQQISTSVSSNDKKWVIQILNESKANNRKKKVFMASVFGYRCTE